ncbi:alpha-(1-_3)-arabinofuranosyltransferase [Nocardiopsis sp. L17-MgMaSL7]|uniref:alpha-(1->3)-arabinofuranosyltransferase n=1 Tax=Nocardiopsis sp. L17-MgMaSL7 TaxID=1938893 RepID=UPI000D996A51|nr:alpha-(1->3)-arabinofuranosyltransferase [Nocardiopsis sp. L17-MgMaSL7]PWV50097.1 arabinofuranan 3-O-arabinosyltransferase [Nocardiopsis sp. L17-MgMaSL7]
MTSAESTARREPEDSRTPTAPGGVDERLLARLKVLAVCLLLGALAASIDPGRIVSDTKIDLTVNPLGFMERALHLWDASYFGQLQNQAYGYFFPNGPFHLLFEVLGMPEWLIQRLWMAVLLIAAFVGVYKVAGALGLGTVNTRIIAGVAYALAPRVLTLLSYNSAELQPMLLMPWILLPLVLGSRHGYPPARMALLSGLAFLLCGGTNAASELAVLVVPGLYLLTRAGGPRKWRLILWWSGALVLASFWYVVPLLIMSRYVYSFMPYTEDAAVTTGIASLFNSLRGTSNWMGFLPDMGNTALPSGAELSLTPWLVAVTALVAGLGLAGLINRRTPERLFLISCLLVGTVIVVAGHTGALTGPFAPLMRDLFDGALAPFRNVHKFDALIRLPIVLGLAHLPVVVARDWADRRGRDRDPGAVAGVRRTVAGASAAVFLVTLTPIATVGIAPRGGFEEIPDHWYEAVEWLEDQGEDRGMTMALPGSARGEYEWGRPLDEPMQPLLSGAWTNHQIIPWGSSGVSRINHEIDQRVSSGRGSEGLADTLARLGVTHLIVRNDLQRVGNNGGWPARVHQSLRNSPGVTEAAEFGPVIGSVDHSSASQWFDQPYPSLTIYEVEEAAPTVGTVPSGDALRVTGGPESVLHLAEQGMVNDDRPILLGDDPGADAVAAQDTIVTDTVRRREVVYSDVRRNVSATMTEDQELERDVPAPDIMDPAWEEYVSHAEDLGVAGVTASSSEAGVESRASDRDPGHAPHAALDSDLGTAWRSSAFAGALGQWIEVEFEEPRDLSGLSVAFEQLSGEPPPSRVTLITDEGRTEAAVAATGEPQELAAPPGLTTTLRVRIDELAWEPEYRFGTRVGISMISVPGLEATRTLRVPGPTDAGTLLFTGSTGTAPGCMEGSHAWVCNPRLEVSGEDASRLDRTFDLSAGAAAGPHAVSGEVVLTDPREAENAANRAGGYPLVTGSSTAVSHPAAMGRGALDDDEATVWYPDPEEREPWLDIELGEPTAIDHMRVEFPRADSVMRPIRVTVEGGGTVREGWLDGSGRVDFAELTASSVRVTFERPEGQALEIGGVELPGVPAVDPLPEGDASTTCGLGPTLRVNDQRVETRISDGTLADQLTGRPLRYETCTDLDLTEGENRIVVDPGNRYQVRSAVVTTGDGAAGVTPEVHMAEVDAVHTWGPGERRFDVDVDEDSLLVVNENFNEGWEARIDGGDGPLEPVRLEGWKQAWALPEGSAGTVTLTYTPDAVYHRVLVAGGALAALLVVLALWPRRWLSGGRRSTAAHLPHGSRALPGVGPGWLPRRVVLPLGLAYGVWVAGWAGAAVVGLILLTLWWLARRAPKRLRHAKPGRPSLGGRALPYLAGPWVVTVSLALAGLAMASGTHLVVNMPFHDITETLGTALRGWVPQALCLPAMARLVLALGQRGDEHGPPPAGSPEAPAEGSAETTGGGDRRTGPPENGTAPEKGTDRLSETGHDVEEVRG